MRTLFLTVLVLCTGLNAKANEPDPWILSTESRNEYTGVTLANGNLGLVTSSKIFETGNILINGLYDKGDAYNAVSSGICGPSVTRLAISLDGEILEDSKVSSWKQSLNMKEAYALTSFDYGDCHFEYWQYVLRDLPYSMLTVVEATPSKDMEIGVVNNMSPGPSLKEIVRFYDRVNDCGVIIPMNCLSGMTTGNSHEVSAASTFLFDDPELIKTVDRTDWEGETVMGFKLKLDGGKTFRFAVAGAICSTADFGTPRNESQRLAELAQCKGLESLIRSHNAAWAGIWESDIIVEGDPESQQDIHSALYHLYSFVRDDNRQSPSPMGLSSNGYNRHVFWDSELWMFPPLLALHPEMAKSMVDYRYDRIPAARNKAAMYGYDGVMFPWESDDTGEEACPLFALTGALEHHITADVGIAAWNYYCVTGDKEWLKTEGWTLISGVAEFLASRVVRGEDGRYSIENVSGADEYACNVNDNAFTNGSAKRALLNAVRAAGIVGKKADPAWETIANNLAFNYFEDGVMMEHRTYSGVTVKQADVNLLAYPLGLMTDREEILKNLLYYSDRIDAGGPAMGNCILSTIWSMLGDSEQAFKYFKKSYVPHKCPPFGVLSESAGGRNPYFGTGAGGALQAVIFGFAGLRIGENGIEQVSPCLPKNWKSLAITGVGPEKKTYRITR